MEPAVEHRIRPCLRPCFDLPLALIPGGFPMTDAVKVGFVPFSTAPKGILVVFCDDALKLGAATRKALGAAADTIKRAAAANQFKGKSGAVLDILAPDGIKIQ